MARKELIVLGESNKKVCNFCALDDIDPLSYGPLYMFDDVVAHYYCVLLSHKMRQRGKDEQGILGFLISDIRAEIRRANKIKCSYCSKYTASLQCSYPKCNKKFHLPCGLKQGSMHQFMKLFLSFCIDHRPKQDIPPQVLCEAESHNPICSICYELVDYKSVTEVIWAPCCSKTWYHRICVQQLANSAGYFFKCAICNNTEKFQTCMLEFGIFIPEKDASWELEPNAFQDLYFRYTHCDAEECKCPHGRNHHDEGTRWDVILCRSCGSQGIHIFCGKLKYGKPTWECLNCGKVPGNTVEESASASAISSASSVSSSSSEGFQIRSRRSRKTRSKSLENKGKASKRRYRLRIRGILQARRRSQTRNSISNDESVSDSSLDEKSLSSLGSRRSEGAPTPLTEEPSVATRSSFSRNDPRRRSEPVSTKRKRKVVDETNEEGEKVKRDRRKKRRSLRDENLQPETDTGFQTDKVGEKSKDGIESSSSKSAESENSKESSELEKEENPKDEKIDKKSSNDFSEVLTSIKPGPLRFKLAALKKAGKDPSEAFGSDDDILELPKPEKKTVLINLSDTDDKTESDVDIEEVEIQPMNLMYRVKKEFNENESEEEVLVVGNEVVSGDSDGSVLPDTNIIKTLVSSGVKVITGEKLLILKTEPEIEEIENVPEIKEKEKEVEKAVEEIVKEMKEKTPEPEAIAKSVVEVAKETIKEKMKAVELSESSKKEIPEPKSSAAAPFEEKTLKPELIGPIREIQQPPNEKWCTVEGKLYSMKQAEDGKIILVPVTEASASTQASNAVTSTASSQPNQTSYVVKSTAQQNPISNSVTSFTTTQPRTSHVVARTATSQPNQMSNSVTSFASSQPRISHAVASTASAPQKSSMSLSDHLAAISGSLPPSTSCAPISTSPANVPRYSSAPANYQSPIKNPQMVSCAPPKPNPGYQYSQPRTSMSSGMPTNYNPPQYSQQNMVPTTGYVQFPAPRSTRPPTSTYVPSHSSSTTYPSPSKYGPSSSVRQPPTSYPSQMPVSGYAPQPSSHVPAQAPQSSYMNTPQCSNYSQSSQAQPSTSTYSQNTQSLPSFPEFEVVGALRPITNQEYVLSPSMPPTTSTAFRSPPSQYSTSYSTSNMTQSYSTTQSTTPSNFDPKIVDVCSLSKDNSFEQGNASDFGSSTRKSSNPTQVTPNKRHSRKQAFPQPRMTTPPRFQLSSPSQEGVKTPRLVARIPPTQTPRSSMPSSARTPTKTPPKNTPEKPKKSSDDEIVIIDEKKPPIPALQPIPSLRNRPKGPSRPQKNNEQDVIQLD